MYLKFSTRNYSIAGKRVHQPASKDILPYLTLPLFSKNQMNRVESNLFRHVFVV